MASLPVTRRLQAVIHAAARLITGIRRNQHITVTIRDILHRLCSWRLTVLEDKDENT